MTSRGVTLAVVVAASLWTSAATAEAQDVLVLAPPDLQPSLSAWKAHRESRGLRVAVREPGTDPAATVRAVRKESGGKLRFVMIAGDVDRVASAFRPVVATAKWETEPEIATDAPFADVDDDGVPDLAIGRVPADSPDELRAMLARVVAHETDRNAGDWRRRLSVVAGTGGFGPLQDAALEQMTKQFLTKDVPPEFVVTGTYGNPLSAWCPPPAEFADTVLRRFAEGALVLAYIGHGNPNELDRVRMARDRFPILGPAEIAKLECAGGAPVTVFIACSTGKFDAAKDCLAEELLRRPKGPHAIIASSRVSTPYGNGILSREMLLALFDEKVATAGELLLRMKRRLVDAKVAEDEERRTIEKLAASFYDPDAARREADRREHLALYNLLGDPCAAIERPAEMAVSAAGTVTAGTSIDVAGTAPAAGRVVVEIARRRDAPTPIGSRKTTEDWRAAYQRANALEVARVETRVTAGAFRIAVPVPADAKTGPGYVRVWFEGDGVCAAGGRYLDIAAADAPSPQDGTAPTAPAPRGGSEK